MESKDQDKLRNFLKWAAKLGVSDSPSPSPSSSSPSSSSSSSSSSCLGHSLTISSFPSAGGRGLAAARELKKGELILRVPKIALMTTSSVVNNDPKLQLAFSNYNSLSPSQVLTVCLLAEMNKGKRSAWYPYLLQLPRSYDTLPSFGPFETKALQVDDGIWLTEKVILKAQSDWREAVALLENLELKPQLVNFKAWLWASATISSRTLHVSWDSAGCLCPVGDFFNYAAPGEEEASIEESSHCDSLLQIKSFQNGDDTKDPLLHDEQSDACSYRLTDGGYEEQLAAYCFYAKRNYKKGEQVLLSYGTYTNLELLEHYGFLLDRNPNDKVFIPLEHDIFACYSWPADSLYIQHNGKPSFSLLSALRFWSIPLNQRKSVSYLALSGSQISLENDITVMKWLFAKCRTVLNSLPSTIKDDKSLLSAIDTAQQLQSLEKPKNLTSVAAVEFHEFLDSMELCCEAGGVTCTPYLKVKRSMDRWKLAVQWRLRYKQTLLDCLSSCYSFIESVTSGNNTNRTV